MNDGQQIFDSLTILCNLLDKYRMNECALITFLENYSENVFDINNIDNRLRTPLHNAAVKGDNGVRFNSFYIWLNLGVRRIIVGQS